MPGKNSGAFGSHDNAIKQASLIKRSRRALIARIPSLIEPLERRVMLSGTVATSSPSQLSSSAVPSVTPAQVSPSTFPAPTVTWTNASGGFWDVPGNWSTNTVPGPTDDVSINVPGNVTITFRQGSATVHSLYSTDPFSITGGTLGVTTNMEVDNTFTESGGTLQTATVLPGSGGQGLTATGGALDGVTLNSGLSLSGNSSITVQNGLTLNGTAALGNSTGNTYGYIVFSGSQSLLGTGSVVFGSTSAFNALVASGTNPVLTIGSGITVSGQTGFLGYDPSLGIGSTTSLINNGTIQWTAGTNINIPTTITNNGTMSVSSTGILNITGTITGGTITTQTGAAINGARLDGVTVSGNFGINNNSNITVLDGLTLNGRATLGSSTSSTTYGYIVFSGSESLLGTGNVVFGSTSAFNALVASGTNPILTIGSGITVSGQTGFLGYDPSLGIGSTTSVINNGTIQWTAGTNINIPTTITNNATMSVSSTGILNITGTISGGTLTTQSGAAIDGGKLDGVTISGNFGINGNNNITVLDGLTLNGTATLGSSTGSTTYGYIVFSGSESLLGTGSVVFGSSSFFNALVASGTNPVLTIGSGITVSGQTGLLGDDPSLGIGSTTSVINNGTIQWSTGTNINFPTALTNNGTMTVSSTGVFNITGTLSGGVLTTQTGALITGGKFDGVTISGNFGINGNNNITVLDGLTLNGTATLGSSTGSTTYGYIVFSGSQSLLGTGSVVFGSGSFFNALLASGTSPVLTIGSGITVSGQIGFLGSDPSLGIGNLSSLINNGTIQANVAGGTINIDTPSNTFSNSGSLTASAGNLAITTGSGGVVNNGNLSAGATGAISISGKLTESSAANLNIVLGGSTTSLYGHVSVSGSAGLDGSLNISEANGFSPSTGNIFQVLTYASATGQFANYSGLDLPGGAALEPAQNPTSVSLTFVSSTTIAPDLRASNITLSPPNPVSGQPLTINWNDINAGNGATGGSWTDHVVVTNTTTSQTIASFDIPFDATANGSIASGGSFARSAGIQLPNGTAGAGNLQVSVTVDYYNTIAEFYPGNVGESNNTTTINAVSTLNNYPDLQVTGLNVSPNNPQSGEQITISWNDANTGAGATTGSWNDGITIVNTTTGKTLINASVQYNAAASGNIAAGASAPQSLMFQLPDGTASVGQLAITITANVNNNLFEFNSSGTATTNNTTSTNITSTLAPYPDLAVSNVTAPPSAPPGQQITVGWTLSNTGGSAANGPWAEQIMLATDAAGDNPILISALSFAGPVPANQQVSRSASVQIPAFLAPGNYWVVVSENPYNQVFETNTANNTAVAATPSAVPVALTLTLASHSVNNAAGPNATTATISRNGATTSSLLVNIANTDTTDVTVPSQVTIPAGQSSVTFAVGVNNPGVVRGTQQAMLTASAGGAVAGSDTLTVTDSAVPTLTVSLGTHSINENATNPAGMGTVTRNTPTTNPLVVTLISNSTGKLQVPASVTIPAGQSSVSFPLTVVNDQQIDGNSLATVTASATGFINGADSATVVDTNLPTITLNLADHTVSEAAGASATTGTITLSAPAVAPFTLKLSSSDTTAATVPAQVLVSAGATSVTFPVTAIDDGLDLGNKQTTITAQIITVQGVPLTVGQATDTLTLLEHDGPALSITLPVAAISQKGSTLATITRNTSTTNPLVVTLASNNTQEATVPPTVTIPAGQASTTFLISGVNNGSNNGEQFAQISASASGINSAVAAIGVTSVNLPDLAVTTVNAPSSGFADTNVQVSWTVTNNGLFPGGGTWNDQVYLDPLNGASGGGLIATVPFAGSLNVGSSYTQNATIALPNNIGQYAVRVITDTNNQLQELSFQNNSLTGPTINVQPPYTATVSTMLTAPISIGTPVTLSGHATLTASGQPAANSPVTVFVIVNGMQRTLSATTDANGNYSTVFQPLGFETGNYSVSAVYPGAPAGPSQAQFTIVGMTATPGYATLQVLAGTPLTGQFTLTNLDTTSLTGITAVAQGGPTGLQAQLTVASTIAGSGQTSLSYKLTSTTGGVTGPIVFHVTSAEGAVLDIPINVSVIAPTPLLAADPTYLNAGMLVGQQTLVSFKLTNNGGSDSGPINLVLPNVSYLSIASMNPVPSLAPGASTTITLSLNPAANLPLAQYTGSISIDYGATGMSLPYSFRAITSAVGDVQIIVDDIFTFTAAGTPRVAGATVQLLDPFDNSRVIAAGTTDSNGLATIPSVPAGQYLLRVSAPQHDSYNASFTVNAGITNVGECFLTNSLVTYTWQVTPTTISDQYDVTLQTTFQTDVPAPVVTLSAPDQIPTLQPGQSGQFNITVTNHGLIAAESVSIAMPTDPEYTFAALATNLGTIPAKSSVTVPVVVTRAAQQLARAAATASPAAAEGDGGCTVDVPATYFVICGGIKHELTTATTVHIPDRICNAGGIIAAFLLGLSHGGGGGFFTIPRIPVPWDVTEPPGVILPPGQDPPPLPIDDTKQPPAVDSPSNCDPGNELAGALAAQALAAPIVGPINLLFTGNNLANHFLNGTPAPSPSQLLSLMLGAGGKLAGAAADLGALSKDAGEAMQTAGDALDNLNGAGATLDESGHGIPGISPFFGGGEASPALAPLASSGAIDAALADVKTAALASEQVLNTYAYFFGNLDFMMSKQPGTLGAWLGQFMIDTGHTTDGSITAADRASLLSATLPDTVTTSDVNAFLDRWNQTVAYADVGIFTASQVFAGGSTNFIDAGDMTILEQRANNAMISAQAVGYTDPLAQLRGSLNQFITAVNDNSVCATIKLQIDQTVSLTRSAFDGTLDITNNETSGPLTNVQVNLHITDANGNPADGLFFISSPTVSGSLTAVDGTGSLAVGASGTVSYTFIPSENAALTAPTVYFIGGTFSYVDPDTGTLVVTPIYSSAITVYPQAKLTLNYFLQKDVIGDDPSTDVVEPSEPAVLGVLVTNSGGGTANNLSITTGQPQIVENEKGLLDTFQIIGTQVGTQPVTPSLTVNFGNLDPGQTGDAEFLLLSSLLGQFQDFSATFTHGDALGGTQTSLIDSVVTHRLIHAGDFQFPGSSGEVDYLANDIPDPNSLPDTVYLSNGSVAPVNVALSPTASAISPTLLSVQVTANVTSGWTYIQLPDPGAGFTLYKVVRSDGAVIPVSDEAWTTDRTIAPTGKSIVDNELHILDLNSTGSYTVFYRPLNATAPVVTSIQQITSPQSGAVTSVGVTFNEPIDPTTFTSQNVTLTLNGGPNLITSGVTISQTSPTTFSINNLAGLTGANGNYLLTVSAVGIQDFFGDGGTGSLSQSWATGTNVPVIVSVGAGDPALRNTPLQSTTVVLSEPIVASSLDYHALSLTLNGGLNLITSAVTVSQINPTTYQINGLGSLTTLDGAYVLTVNASGLVDGSNNSGVGSLAETWQKSTVGPTIAALQPVTQSPRNIVVPTLDVTFSEAIDPTSFTYQAITYSKAGGPNLITPSITITQLSPTEFQIGNFNNLVFPIDGTYTFTVDASTVKDLYGNLGTGTASDTWVLDTGAPDAPTNLAISPDTGEFANDGVTNTTDVTLTGSIGEPGLRVEVYDGQSTKLADATVNGTSFSASLFLGAGAHSLRVYTVDAAGNVSGDTFLNVNIDTTPPTATFAQVAQSNPQQAVGSVVITFSEVIDESSLSFADFSLTLNGGPNLLAAGNALRPLGTGIGVGPAFTHLSGNTWQINNLDAFDGAQGQYVFSLIPGTIKDVAGNANISSPSVSWGVEPAVQATSFSNLTASLTTTYGTLSETFSGTITANGLVPANGEFVSITLNGVTKNAAINAQGGFAASFDTSTLPASSTPYHVTYQYAGDATLGSATDNSTTTLTINRADAVINVTGYNVGSNGQPHTATGTVTGVNGEDLSADLDLSGTVHTAPGTYTDTWSFTDPSGNYNTATGTVTDTITAAAAVTPNVSATDPGGTYSGNPFAVTAASVSDPTTLQVIASFGDPTLSYTYYQNTGTTLNPVWVALSGAPTNAGSYRVIAHYTSNNPSYNSADSAPTLFSIAKADATIIVNGFSGTYDGNAHGATGSATGVNGEDLSSLLHLGSSFIDFPGGTANWTFDGNTNYNAASNSVQISIAQASAIFGFSGFSGPYDGGSHPGTGSATGVETPTPANLSALLHLTYENLATSTFSSSAPIHAGNYEVFYTFDGNTDYKPVTQTDAQKQISISQKSLTASIISDPTKPYDSTNTATLGPANFKILGLVGTEGFTVTQTAGNYNDIHVLSANMVTATLNPTDFTPSSGTLASDYVLPTSASGAGAITAAKITYQIGNDSQTYGKAANLTADLPATFNTGVNNETLGITYQSTGDTGTANVNAYPITGTLSDGTGSTSDYSVNLLPGVLTVNRASAIIKVTGYKVLADGNPHTATGTATGVFGESLSGLDLTGTTHTAPDTYSDTWTFTDTTGNYNNSTGSVTDIISTALATTLGVTAATGTYGGTTTLSATLTIAGGPVSGELVSFSFDNGMHTVGSAMTNAQGVATLPNVQLQTSTGALIAAGTYSNGIYASFGGDTSYVASSGAAALTVGKASFTYQIGSDTHVYGSTDNLASDLGTSISTGINNETLNIAYSSSGNTSTAAVGTYDITGVLSDSNSGLLSNYNVTLNSGTLSVSQANTTTTLIGPSSIPYGGATVVFTANFSAVSPSAATVNEGTVTFTLMRGSTTLQTVSGVAVTNGSAGVTFNLGASFIAGSYTVAAAYVPKTASPDFNSSSISQPLTIAPAAVTVAYTGPTSVNTSKSKSTVSVTLQAAVTDPRGNSANYSVANATVSFYDMSTGVPVLLAANVRVVLASTANSSIGMATTTVILSTGAFESHGYLIRAVVGGSYAGSNDSQPLASKMLAVSQPVSTDTIFGTGSIPYLSSAAGSLIAPNSNVSYTFGLKFTRNGTTGQNRTGEVELFIQQPNGGPTYIVRSSTISSLTFSGARGPGKKGIYPDATFLAANASIYQINSDGTETLVLANATMLVHMQDGNVSPGPGHDDFVGFTILSPANTLQYSNNWDPNTLKTLLQDVGLGKSHSVVID